MKSIFYYACVACILMLSSSKILFAQDFNHLPDWTTSADGVLSSITTNGTLQIQAAYGYKVISLGDINGDGYPDIAVSAPTMVATSNTSIANVGAVFIFFGSSTGPHTTPDRILQPTTVAGALFGFSLAVGDVDGDHVNDLVVGAPGDHISISSGTLTGNVGKIYVYSGATLASLTNPSPLVSLNLDASLLSPLNIGVNALFGFSVAVTNDLNGDGKGDIIVGAPTYANITSGVAVQTGGAFIFLSDNSNSFSTSSIISLAPPTGSVLGLTTALHPIIQTLLGSTLATTVDVLLDPVLNGQISGLLFGFSVDGIGDYNLDGHSDVVVGAPAGVNIGTLTSGINLTSLFTLVPGLLTSLNTTLNGQILGGTSFVYSGTGTSSVAKLQASSSGLLSSAANLFGFSVKGVTDTSGVRNGNILIGAPTGALVSNITTLQLKAGNTYVFRKPSSTPSSSTPIAPDQTLSSPRSNNIITTLGSLTGNFGLMFGASIDNMRDVNGDGYDDIIIGEPLNTGLVSLGGNVIGGAAHIFLGKSDGTYNDAPVSWTLNPTVSTSLGVNAASLVGFSVSGYARPAGAGSASRPIIGAPGMALDFGSGLLNLGNTVGTLLNFTAGNNGLGKAYTFDAAATILPVNLISFTGEKITTGVQLQWTTSAEFNSQFFEVQRSADGASFVKIGQVGAAGNSGGSNIDYSFLDPAPLTGPNYYRLKMVDIDGAYQYSSTLLIRLTDVSGSSVIINPNPVVDKLQLSWKNMPAADYTIDIINPAGKIVNTQKITVNSSVQTNVIPRESSWGNGFYVVVIRSTKDQFAIKVLLQ